MIVEIAFPDGENYQLGFSGSNVPRSGEILDIGDAPAGIPQPRFWKVEDVTWVLDLEGCAMAVLAVTQIGPAGIGMPVGVRRKG